MHYANGRESKLGDVVVGKGYNVKDQAGQLKRLVGIVVGLTPGAECCNIRVAHDFHPWASEHLQAAPYAVFLCNGQTPLCCPDIEYGQCDQFLHVEDALATTQPDHVPDVTKMVATTQAECGPMGCPIPQ